MSDLAQIWGNDIAIASNGDLLLSSNDDLIRERIFRRLLTNAGDYTWHLAFGAGLPQTVGTPLTTAAAAALIHMHLRLEPSVAISPKPVIELKTNVPNNPGLVAVNIRYVSAISGALNAIAVLPTE